ncbi:MAG: sulfate adenylyltransferase subunit CysD [Bacteroidetes bacterium]|jgi:sulfate adenylyltransferase subunit 2|nr:sulfate adenylyltransferase subunit CysD [Bacteroidota bacterium]
MSTHAPTQALLHLDYLDALEAEAIYILREVAGQFERPALLFSGGKDSITLVHLARKAFAPGPLPFPLVHIDTGHNFEEVIAFRDQLVKQTGARLVVGYVQDSIDAGKVVEQTGKNASRNALQTVTLLDTIQAQGYDACIGGARRDEEKARAKERVFSFRNSLGAWDPKRQRPELWSLYNGKINPGENVRCFPISNWTELDVWNYIRREQIALPTLYFAHTRQVVRRQGQWLAAHPILEIDGADEVTSLRVRFRTVGDISCTAALESEADTLDTVIEEISQAQITERGTRIDDKASEAAMEDRKKGGYF